MFDLSLEVFCNIYSISNIYMQVQLRSAQFEGEVCFRCACLSGSLILSLLVQCYMHKLVTKQHTIVEAYFDLSSITLYLILV